MVGIGGFGVAETRSARQVCRIFRAPLKPQQGVLE
jgi:hypothetical protein